MVYTEQEQPQDCTVKQMLLPNMLKKIKWILLGKQSYVHTYRTNMLTDNMMGEYNEIIKKKRRHRKINLSSKIINMLIVEEQVS